MPTRATQDQFERVILWEVEHARACLEVGLVNVVASALRRIGEIVQETRDLREREETP